MSSITRRNFFKFLSISAGTTLLAKETESNDNKLNIQKTKLRPKKRKAHRVVVIGGGMGGISVAESIKDNDPKDEIEVIILERNAHYFTCPMSNTLFGEIEEVKKENIPFKYDYTACGKKS